MKQKLTLKKGALAYFLFTAMACVSLQAQSLFVLEKNNVLSSFTVDNLKNLKFSNGKIIIVDTNGNSNETTLANIRHLSFVDYTNTTNIETQDKAISNFRCYPNPTSNNLNIEMANVEGQVSVEILSTSGQVMLKENKALTNTSYSIDVSGLSEGIYLCKVNSEESMKLTPFIKQ